MVLKVYGVPLRLKCCLILPLISVMYEIRPIKWFCKVLQSSNCALEWRKSSIAMECWAITTSINQTCPEKDLRAPFWNIPKISFLCSTWDVRPPSKVLVWDIPARSFFVSLGMFLELKWDVPGSSRTPRWDIPGTYLGCMCVVWGWTPQLLGGHVVSCNGLVLDGVSLVDEFCLLLVCPSS